MKISLQSLARKANRAKNSAARKEMRDKTRAFDRVSKYRTDRVALAPAQTLHDILSNLESPKRYTRRRSNADKINSEYIAEEVKDLIRAKINAPTVLTLNAKEQLNKLSAPPIVDNSAIEQELKCAALARWMVLDWSRKNGLRTL
jgi:hypothetical protein